MKNNGKRTWTKDEYIKTMDLFFELIQEKSVLTKDNAKIQRLAAELNRSVNSVVMRLQNYVAYYKEIDPKMAEYYGLGNGLINGGKECRYMLENYLREKGENSPAEKNSPAADFDAAAVNRIIVKLAVKYNDEDFDSDGAVFNSLNVLLRFIHEDAFSLSQLIEISNAYRIVFDGPHDKDAISKGDVIAIVRSVVGDEIARRLEVFVKIFR